MSAAAKLGGAGANSAGVAAKLAGAAIFAAALSVGAVDGYHAVRNFSSMGPLPPGQALPGFSVALLEGGDFTSAELEGHVTVMTFWATWCGACRSELGDLDELDDAFAGNAEVQFLAVNWEGSNVAPAARRKVAADYKRRSELGLDVAYDDGTVAKALRVGPIPHTVVLDRNGTLRHIHQGRVSSSTIEDEINDLLEE